jgi:hypothetical protein
VVDERPFEGFSYLVDIEVAQHDFSLTFDEGGAGNAFEPAACVRESSSHEGNGEVLAVGLLDRGEHARQVISSSGLEFVDEHDEGGVVIVGDGAKRGNLAQLTLSWVGEALG